MKKETLQKIGLFAWNGFCLCALAGAVTYSITTVGDRKKPEVKQKSQTEIKPVDTPKLH